MTLIERTIRERIVLVGVVFSWSSLAQVEEDLDELELLVATAGADVVARVIQRRAEPDPATLLGKGKAAELHEVALSYDADTVVFDDGADARPAAESRARARKDGDRPDRGDPRHIRPERELPGGQGAGGARPPSLPASAPAGDGDMR